MKIGTREILRNIDSQTIEKYGVPGAVLMENAGRAVSNVIVKEFPDARSVAVFCGSGNNGGDGFVVARHLIKRGLSVKTYIKKNLKDYSGDAAVNLDILRKMDGEIIKLKRDFTNFSESDIVVDAIFGTGLDREVSGQYREIIEFINTLGSPKIAIDMPSGIDANNGNVLGISVNADITVTFVIPKIGLCVYPGAEYSGRIYVADISTPPRLEDKIPYELITPGKCRTILKPRKGNSHKGTYGHLLVLAGSTGKSGAAYLCSVGAARAGTGLVTIGIPGSIADSMEQKTTEVMTEPVEDSGKGVFGPSSNESIREVSAGKSVIATGPGISTSDDTAEFLYTLLEKTDLPVVADADAITLIAKNKGILKKTRHPVILTPHPGEMSRLCDTNSGNIQKNRIGYSLEFAKRYGVFLVLKGARTIVSTPGGKLYINPTGNPGMASGGMGDVLTGVIAGFLSQGYSQEEACIISVFLHGLAGDMIAEHYGSFGYLASEVADILPEAADKLLEGTVGNYFEIIH